MNIVTQISTDKLAVQTFKRFGYSQDVYSSTIGSIADFPEIEPGTIDWDPLMKNYDGFLLLEKMAYLGDEIRFIQIAQGIDWEVRTADEFVKGIQMAISAGANQFARKIATLGVEKFKSSKKLKKLSYLLSPPKVIRNDLAPDNTLKANRDWIKSNKHSYQGKWVALKNGTLIDHSDTLRQLREKIGEMKDVLVVKVS